LPRGNEFNSISLGFFVLETFFSCGMRRSKQFTLEVRNRWFFQS